MGQVLYRAYRSKKLSEIVGQEHITTALARALAAGTIAHAYLFTGPRGVGKTSIARILAHEINNLPYDDDQSHLDIIEIDAASNRRIDEIRDLRDKVHIAPASAKYKVYIIDEVHMLTKEAFNALLKTLEEPPAHVIFILATTEVHKLPETIVSRTQRFAFKPVGLAKVVAHLRTIADAEKITIDDDALELIAAHGEGSFRDSISLLDQVRNTASQVTLTDVQTMLGIPPGELIVAMADLVAGHDAAGMVRTLETLQMQGFEPAQIARQLGRHWREALLAGQTPVEHEALFKLLGQLVDVPAANNPGVALELALIEASLQDATVRPTKAPAPARLAVADPPAIRQPAPKHSTQAAATPQHKMADGNAGQSLGNESEPEAGQPKASRTKLPAGDKAAGTFERASAEPTGPPASGVAATLAPEIWQQALASIRQQYNTLYGIARMAQPRFEPGAVVLVFAFPFHQKRLNDPKNREILAQTIEAVCGQAVQVRCEVGDIDPNAAPADDMPPPLPLAGETVHHVGGAPAATDSLEPEPSQAADQPPTAVANQQPAGVADALTAISNIFGESELLES